MAFSGGNPASASDEATPSVKSAMYGVNTASLRGPTRSAQYGVKHRDDRAPPLIF